MNLKHNIPLVVGLAIPVLMIVLVFAAIYVPRLLVTPTYDFLYTIDQYPTYIEQRGDEYIEHRYEVQGDQLIHTELVMPTSNNGRLRTSSPPRLYLYSVASDSSREISFAEAEALRLDNNNESPDGFTISRGNGGGFPFVFDSSNYNTQYLKGHGASLKLNLKQPTDPYHQGSFRFLGWIIQ